MYDMSSAHTRIVHANARNARLYVPYIHTNVHHVRTEHEVRVHYGTDKSTCLQHRYAWLISVRHAHAFYHYCLRARASRHARIPGLLLLSADIESC
jgi:hypothetical protein